MLSSYDAGNVRSGHPSGRSPGSAAVGSSPRVLRLLLRGGVLAGPLFVAVFLLEGATRPDYHPLRHPVSSLALGADGWMQVANFATAGGLYLAFAVGLWRLRDVVGTRFGPLLVGAAAVGLLGAAAFITDPVSGYPPGTPSAPGAYTVTGALHDLFSVSTFLGIPTAAIAFGRAFGRDGHRRWAAYSLGTVVAMLVALGFTSAAFNQQAALVDVGGILQRITVSIGFAWLSAIGVRLLRQLPSP